MRTFRRLLLGLHQDSGDIVDVFHQWRTWRAKNGVDFSDGDRTTYYVRDRFRADFLRFAQLDYLPNHSKATVAVTALVEYEAALHEGNQESAPGDDQLSDTNGDDTTDELISRQSRPRRLPGVNVIQVSADYQEIVRRLRQKSPLGDVPGHPVELAIRRTATGPAEVRQLTPLSAQLLRLCVGSLTVEEIAEEFRERKIEVSGVPPDKLCLAGIEILRQQRLVSLM